MRLCWVVVLALSLHLECCVARIESSNENTFKELDSELLVHTPTTVSQELALVYEDPDPIWKEEGYEPYSDELDSYVTDSGMPNALDNDPIREQRYQKWQETYKRVPNVPKKLWSYDDADTAPDLWSSLEKEFLYCDADLAKSTSSPVDIVAGAAQQTCYGPSFEVQSAPQWEATTSTLSEYFDRSFIVDVANCKDGEGCNPGPVIPKSAEHDNMVLERIVFHTPSEHKLDGETLDMELQFMHCRAAGGTVTPKCRPEMAISVLIKDGGASQQDPPFLAELAKTIKDVGPDPVELAKGLQFQSVAEVISPLLKQFYSYWGSTTYPPCYQRVQWFIPTQVVKASTGVIAAFKSREGDNVRPAFALGTRRLLLLNPEAADHWTYRGPRGADKWGSPGFPWLPFTSCGRPADCEQLPNQDARDKCLAEQRAQSPIDIYTNECRPNVNWGRPCVQQVGLRPLHWNLGATMSEPLKVYLKDCSTCQPCTNENNAYTLTLVAPGVPTPGFLPPGGGGCDSLESCKTAGGYGAATLTYQNSIYALREIVVHTPSEHRLDGAALAAEVQLVADRVDCVKCRCPGWGTFDYRGAAWCCCVPNNDDKPVLIQSVLLARAASGTPGWLTALAGAAGRVSGQARAVMGDLFLRDVVTSIHPTMSTYYLYDGSLSTPPCSTRVQWLVTKAPLPIDDAALAALAALTVGGNARPVQPLNGRNLAVAGTVQL